MQKEVQMQADERDTGGRWRSLVGFRAEEIAENRFFGL